MLKYILKAAVQLAPMFLAIALGPPAVFAFMWLLIKGLSIPGDTAVILLWMVLLFGALCFLIFIKAKHLRAIDKRENI